jgi:glucose-6-phosphate dehydrogenase assembly protein OpcA
MEDVMSDTTPTILPGAVSVPLPNVEHELARQLNLLQTGQQEPVQCVRMSNLVIYCNRVETAEKIARYIPEIVAVHPARLLLLLGENGSTEAKIQAAVKVQVQQLGEQQQACSDQVFLSAPSGLVEHLPFVVRSLAIGDLPTNLWWASNQPPPMGGHLLYELGERAQQIIYDSQGWTDPTRGVAATAAWLEQTERTAPGQPWRVASDLNWRRLKYWRRLVWQALEPIDVDAIAEVWIEHGPHAVVEAWELASWLVTRLGWPVQGGKVQPGVEMTWRFKGPSGDVRFHIKRNDQGPPTIRSMRIACVLEKKAVMLNLTAESNERLAIQLEGVDAAPRTIMVPALTAAEVIGRQLSDRERDPVFRESMAVAQVMARSLLS